MKNCGTTVQNALRASHNVKHALVSFEEGLASVWLQNAEHDVTEVCGTGRDEGRRGQG